MPTFETNVPAASKPSGKADSGSSLEFRPRRREQWQGAGLDETFDPAPIPPAAKAAIDQRVSDIMRQCRGPDETFFAIREWWSTFRKVMSSLPAFFKDLLHRSDADDDDDEEEVEEEAEAEEESEQNSSEPKPRAEYQQKPRQQQQQHRGHRGGRRHYRKGGPSQNKDRRNNDWRNEEL